MSIRYKGLDSLRGLASLSVVFHHCFLVFPVLLAATNGITGNSYSFVNLITYSPLHLFWAGHEAVLLFFILSGFVLTLLFLNKKPSFGKYIFSRFSRIYLPYMFSIILSVLFMEIIDNKVQTSLSTWFNTMWAHPLSFKELCSYIFMLGFDVHNINTVTWSLVHEMRISIFFPVIIYVLNKYTWKKASLIGVGVLASFWVFFTSLSVVVMGANEVIGLFLQSIGMTFYYSLFFLLGALLAKHKDKIWYKYGKMNSKMTSLLVILFILLYTLDWWLPFIPSFKTSSNIIMSVLSTIFIEYSIAIGVVILFFLALNSKMMICILNAKPLLFLGRISYSLYLIHPIVLLVMVHILNPYFPPEIIVVFVPIFSILFASIMNKFVENPSIRLGRWFSERTEK